MTCNLRTCDPSLCFQCPFAQTGFAYLVAYLGAVALRLMKRKADVYWWGSKRRLLTLGLAGTEQQHQPEVTTAADDNLEFQVEALCRRMRRMALEPAIFHEAVQEADEHAPRGWGEWVWQTHEDGWAWWHCADLRAWRLPSNDGR